MYILILILSMLEEKYPFEPIQSGFIIGLNQSVPEWIKYPINQSVKNIGPQ